MGNVCSWKKKKGLPRKLTLAILGLDNAGKTVAAKGLQGASLDTVAPTIGFSNVDFKFDGQDITLFDLGGGKRIRDIWKNYFSEVYGVIYVIDASDAERMEECKGVLKNLLEHNRVCGKPVLILANKQDVDGALDEIDICEHLNLEELVNMNKSPCRVETCTAITGQGKKLDKSIKSGMVWLLETIANLYEKLQIRVEKDMSEQREKETREKQEKRERVRKMKEEREKGEAAERVLRGEPEKGESEEDEMVGGDPFKRLDANELHKKSERLKQEKKRKKEWELEARANKLQSHSDPEDDGDSRPRLNRRNIHGDDISDRIIQQRAYKTNLSPRNELSLPSKGRLPLVPSPRLAHRMNRDKSHSDDSGEESSDETNLTKSPWGNNRSPRPFELKPAPSLTPRLPHRGLGAGEEEAENRIPYARKMLAPLAPLAPLDGGDAGRNKAKKKKAKKNQTAPLMIENGVDEEANYQPKVNPFAPRGWNTPPGQRSMLKASQTPRLETLKEPDSERSDSEANSAFAAKWGLMDDLPELPAGKSSLRPNTDYDYDLVT